MTQSNRSTEPAKSIELNVIDLLKQFLGDLADQSNALKQLSNSFTTLNNTLRDEAEKRTDQQKTLILDLYDKIVNQIEKVKDEAYTNSAAEKNVRIFTDGLKTATEKLDQVIRKMSTNEDLMSHRNECIQNNTKVESIADETKRKIEGYYDLLKSYMDGFRTDRNYENEIKKIKEVSKRKNISQIISYVFGGTGLIYLILTQLIGV